MNSGIYLMTTLLIHPKKVTDIAEDIFFVTCTFISESDNTLTNAYNLAFNEYSTTKFEIYIFYNDV